MKLKLYQKNILSVLVIVVGGFILFNLAFLLTAFVTNAICNFSGIGQFRPVHIIGRGLSLLLILLISWFVLRSDMNDIMKATFLTMPLMVILVIIGISLYQQSNWIIVGMGAVVICAVILYLHKKKFFWLYYFSTFYVAGLALYILFSGMDI